MNRDLARRLGRIEARMGAIDPQALARVRGRLEILAFRLTLWGGPRNAQEQGACELLTEAAGGTPFLEWYPEPDRGRPLDARWGRTDGVSERAAKLLIERGRWDVLERYDRPPAESGASGGV